MNYNSNIIYLDNAANTFMSDKSIKYFNSLLNIGNPSSFYNSEYLKKIDDFKYFIANMCNISLDDYDIIFTSCGSESNNMIVRSVESCAFKPHIIISNIEHKSLLMCSEELFKDNRNNRGH